MTPLMGSKAYAGIDRRSSCERRSGMDRRNLVRYESIGSDRRVVHLRRTEDAAWSSNMPGI